MIPAAFEYLAPRTLREAVRALARYGEDAKLLAGGQSLLPMMKLRLVRPAYLVDLGRVPGLAYIRPQDGGIALGPMTTHYMLESSPLLRERLPVLPEAAAQIADVQVRNRGTIGGSLAHADPAADLPAVMLALDARFQVLGPAGRRIVPARAFFQEAYTTALQPGEVLTQISVPALRSRTGAAYLKFANKASHFAVVGVAAVVMLDSRGRCTRAAIGITGAGPRPLRAEAAEAVLKGHPLTDAALGQAAQQAAEGLDFLEDLFASGEYRAHLTRVLARRALEAARARVHQV